MTAGSSGIMIDAPGWHLGLVLLFGACLAKGGHQSSSRGSGLPTGGKALGPVHCCSSTGSRGDTGEGAHPAQVMSYRVTNQVMAAFSSLKLSLSNGLSQG